MRQSTPRAVFGFFLLLALAPSARGQITFPTPTFTGAFYTSERQAAITAATAYVRTQLDGRGTIDLEFNAQNLGFSTAGYTLAFAGTNYFYTPGVASTTNGIAYSQGTTGSPTDPGYNRGTFNNNASVPWYSGTSAAIPSDRVDMQSVALHEITHALGFASLINYQSLSGDPDGSGVQGNTPGSPDTYGRLDRLLRAGPTTASPLLINANGTYNTGVPTSQLGSGNNYFFGEIAMAANGGAAVRMSADNSHINATGGPADAVMLPNVGNGDNRRAYTNLDLAILIDLGWNQYVWKGNSGDWATNTASTGGSLWKNLDGANSFSPVGTITPNLVLTFEGSTAYTSTNDLNLTANGDRFLVNRVILNNSAGGTIAGNVAGTNVLRFDTTINVTPLIRQDAAGAVAISHPLELTNSSLQLGGNGGGLVTLSGTIGQQAGHVGGITKTGSSVYVLTGANTYTGGTTVSGGELMVSNTSGSGTGTGAVTVNNGAYLSGTGSIAGAVTVNAGGTVRGGTGVNEEGILTLTVGGLTLFGGNATTGPAGARFAVDLAQATSPISSTPTSKLVFGANGFNIRNVGTGGNKIDIVLLGDGNLASTTTPFSIILATGSGGFFRNDDEWDGTTNAFTAADFNVISSSGSWTYGNLTLDVQGNNLVLQFQPVPEPATVLAVGAAGLGAITWLRRTPPARTRAAETPAAA